MRSLVVIPIVHSSVDLGSLAKSVRDYYMRKFGPALWDRRQRAADKIWADIRRRVTDMDLDWSRVRIYQDGLPVCGHEAQIVRELAAAGSLNHQLLLELVERGATLMGTEDPQLLLCEYEAQRRRLGTVNSNEPARTPPGDTAADLLRSRDSFIARRIAETLPEGETGLLFIGAAHRLDALKSSGMSVKTLP